MECYVAVRRSYVEGFERAAAAPGMARETVAKRLLAPQLFQGPTFAEAC